MTRDTWQLTKWSDAQKSSRLAADTFDYTFAGVAVQWLASTLCILGLLVGLVPAANAQTPPPTVTVTALASSVFEDEDVAAFTVTADDPKVSISVNFTVTESAGTSYIADDYNQTSVDLSPTTRSATVFVHLDGDTETRDGTVTVSLTASTDGSYRLGTRRAASVRVRPMNAAGVRVSFPVQSLDEHGIAATSTYEMWLGSDPGGTVTIRPTSGDTDKVTVGPAVLSFDSSNYQIAQPVTLTGMPDADSDNETVTISHSVSGYPGVSSAPNVRATVFDNYVPPTPVANLFNGRGAPTLPEGTKGTFSLTFSGSRPSPLPRGLLADEVVTYALVLGGTATRGTDYTLGCGDVDGSPPPSTITCSDLDGSNPTITVRSAGRDSFRWLHALHVVALDDGTTEADETIQITLRAADGTRGDTVTRTIRDAPTAATVRFSRNSFLAQELTGAIVQPVLFVEVGGRRGAFGKDIPLTFVYTDETATGGRDYTAIRSVMIPAGEDSLSFDIPIINDNMYEEDETFWIDIDTSNLPMGVTAGSTTEATITITDEEDDPNTPGLILTPMSLALNEGGGAGTYSVRLKSDPGGTATVTPASGDTGAATVSGPLTFNSSNWQTPQQVTVTPVNDQDQNHERVTITHRVSGYGSVTSGPSVTVTVAEDEAPDGGGGGTTPPSEAEVSFASEVSFVSEASFVSTTSTAPENAGTFDVPVNLVPAPQAAITLGYTVTGTATADSDYTAPSGSVTVSSGATSVTIPVPITDDHVDEPDETVVLTLHAGTGYTVGGTNTYTLTLRDDDTADLTLSVAALRLTGGHTARYTVTLSSQPVAPVTVTVTSSASAIARVAPATLTFTPATWATPQSVTVTAGTNGTATLTQQAASSDPAYAGLQATLQVRVGEDVEALTTGWLGRLGRTATGQVLGGLTTRLTAPRTPGLTGSVAGQALAGLGTAPAGQPAGAAFAPDRPDPRVNPGTLVRFRDLLANSAFSLTSAPTASGSSYALWGQGAWASFAGQEQGQELDGEALTGSLGVDLARGPWLLGLAVSHTQGDGSYQASSRTGELDSSLTLVTPYVGMQLTDRVTLWGTVGYGRGTLTLTPARQAALETDTSLWLATAGLRGDVWTPPPTGGLSLALQSEARFLRTTTDRVTGLAETEADVTVLRLGLTGAWQQPLADGGAVVPRLELGLRQDAGDAETGLGLELGTGLRWQAPAYGLAVDLAGRGLLTHADQDFETWGAAVSLAWDPDPTSPAGPTLTLRQTYGGPASGGLAAVFADVPLSTAAPSTPASMQLTAEAGWGVPLSDGMLLGVPHVGYGWAPASRELSLGWRLTPATPGGLGGSGLRALTLDLTAARRDQARIGPGYSFALSLSRPW